MRSRRLSLQSYGQPLTCKSATVRDWGRRAPLHGPGAVHSRGLRGRVCSTPRAAQPRRGRGSRDKGSSQARPGGQAGRRRNHSSSWREDARAGADSLGAGTTALPAEPQSTSAWKARCSRVLRFGEGRSPDVERGLSTKLFVLSHKRHRPRLHQTCTCGDVRADPKSQGRARPPRMGTA